MFVDIQAGSITHIIDPNLDPMIRKRSYNKMQKVLDEIVNKTKQSDYDDEEGEGEEGEEEEEEIDNNSGHVLIYNTTDKETSIETSQRLSRKLFLICYSFLRSSRGYKVDEELNKILNKHYSICEDRLKINEARKNVVFNIKN